MDVATGVDESCRGAAPSQGDDFGGDRHRGFFRCSATEVEPDGAGHLHQVFIAQAGLAQPYESILVRFARSHDADIERFGSTFES